MGIHGAPGGGSSAGGSAKKKVQLRLPNILKKYPLATAAVGGAVVLLVGWQVYQGMGQRSAPSPPVPAPVARPTPAPTVPTAPGAPGAPGPTGALPTPPGAAPGIVPPGVVPPGGGGLYGPSGRADPFIPLVSPGGGGGGPVRTYTDVPALVPGAPGVPFPGGGEGGLRVAGIIWDRGVVAIMVDERGSYIVGAGDEISPGLRVVRIDVGRRVVEVQRSGAMQELTLQGRGGAGQ